MKTKVIFLGFGYCIIIGLMILCAHLWNDTWNDILYNGSRCFFQENRAYDIKMVTLCVFNEEFTWRFLPISILSALIILIKNKWAKSVVCIASIVILVLIQLKFGAMHHSPLSNTPCSYNIIMQGGTGIILVLTYVISLISILKITSYNREIKIWKKIIYFTIANGIAYCSAVIVHAASNVIIVLTQTF